MVPGKRPKEILVVNLVSLEIRLAYLGQCIIQLQERLRAFRAVSYEINFLVLH